MICSSNCLFEKVLHYSLSRSNFFLDASTLHINSGSGSSAAVAARRCEPWAGLEGNDTKVKLMAPRICGLLRVRDLESITDWFAGMSSHTAAAVYIFRFYLRYSSSVRNLSHCALEYE